MAGNQSESSATTALPDGSVSAVVSDFFTDLAPLPQWLGEVRRVLAPGGTILFLEHGAAPDAAPARWQQRVEPVWKRIAGGCHLTRPVAQTFADQGFRVDRTDSRYLPKTPRFLGWIEMGEARA